MKRIKITFLLLTIAFSATAQNELSTVYFYSPLVKNKTFSYELYRDTILIGTIKPGVITNDRLPSGTYIFKSKLDNEQTITVTLIKGYNYFVECDILDGEKKSPSLRLVTKSEAQRGLRTISPNAITLLRQKTYSEEKEHPMTQFGIKAGLNLSVFNNQLPQITGSLRPGLNVGFYVKTPLGRSLFFRPEIYYSQEGEKLEYTGYTSVNTVAKIDYIKAPILLETSGDIAIQFGGQIGIPVYGREVGTSGGSTINDDILKITKSPDIALVLGLSFNFSEKIHMGIRYQYSVTNTFNYNSSFPNIQNRVVHTFLGFKL